MYLDIHQGPMESTNDCKGKLQRSLLAVQPFLEARIKVDGPGALNRDFRLFHLATDLLTARRVDAFR